MKKKLKTDPFEQERIIKKWFYMDKRTPTPEKMFEVPIKAGLMRIERRAFKQPKVIWL